MNRKERIEQILQKNLDISFLEIDDKSDSHIGHAGHNGQGESHYDIKISALDFEGLSLLAQHRAVNDLLKEEFSKGLHAVSIKII